MKASSCIIGLLSMFTSWHLDPRCGFNGNTKYQMIRVPNHEYLWARWLRWALLHMVLLFWTCCDSSICWSCIHLKLCCKISLNKINNALFCIRSRSLGNKVCKVLNAKFGWAFVDWLILLYSGIQSWYWLGIWPWTCTCMCKLRCTYC